MSAQIAALAPLALALAALIGVGVVAITVMWSRVLFSIAMAFAVAFVLAALAALALGAPLMAMALAVLGVGIAPVFMLGVMLLTGRAARPWRGRAVVAPAALAGIAAVIAWGARDVMGAAPAHDGAHGVAIWLGALVLAAGVGAFALLAFGERGGFERSP